MSSPATDAVIQQAIDAAGDVHGAIYAKLKEILSQTFDLQGATAAIDWLSAEGAKETITAPPLVRAILGAIVTYFAQAASIILDTFSDARKSGQAGINNLVASLLTDILQIPIDPASLPVGKGPEGAKATNAGIGKAFVDNLAGFFAPGGQVSGANAAKGAETFIGFNMQFAMATGLLTLLGEVFSLGQIEGVGKLGDAMERTLGLGRISARTLRPLFENTVTKPWERSLRAQYRQDLLGQRELAIAVNRGNSPTQDPLSLLRQHGLSDDQINELLLQSAPTLGARELDLLIANNLLSADQAATELGNKGASATVAARHIQVAQVERLSKLRERGMAEVVALVSKGSLPSTAITTAAQTFGIPSDEVPIWTQLAQVYDGVRRKTLAKADILYLYEKAEISLADVETWADEVGFDDHDKQLLSLELVQRASDQAAKQAAASKAASAALHARDVAFVTDSFITDFVRPPSPDELRAWVGLLDAKQRTRADVRAELLRVSKSGSVPANVLPGA